MPNLRQLEYLVAIADTRHFRRAAERAHTTQPTLSEQLKALEHRLGVQLVERNRSRVVMTPIGNQIVQIARRMLSDASEIRSLASSGGRELAGVLRIGLPPTIGPYLLPRVIPDLHARYPDLKLYVREELPNVLPRGLDEGTHDLIVTPLPVKGADLVSVALYREPLRLVVGVDHPLAAKPRVRKRDLEGQDVLALGPGHQLHDVVQTLCEELGANLRLDYEGTSLDMLREMVATGLGITFLPDLYVETMLVRDPSVRSIELEGRAVYRTIGMVWRASSARGATYERLADLIRTKVSVKVESPAETV
jgi:LysR family hydrogen peroxide-inducible transcriptional activator